MKDEIRNPKHETNSNADTHASDRRDQNTKFKTDTKCHCEERSGCEAQSAEANWSLGDCFASLATGSAISVIRRSEIATPTFGWLAMTF